MLAACQDLGGESRELIVAPRATETDIAQVERALGRQLPSSLRAFFAEGSSHVEVEWFLPRNREPPFRGIFSGNFQARLSTLTQLAESHADWIRECFSNRADPYDAVWHDKLPVLEVGNGDFIAVYTAEDDGAVVYLSHDDGQGHGRVSPQAIREIYRDSSLVG